MIPPLSLFGRVRLYVRTLFYPSSILKKKKKPLRSADVDVTKSLNLILFALSAFYRMEKIYLYLSLPYLTLLKRATLCLE